MSTKGLSSVSLESESYDDLLYYTERATALIYEVKFFPDFVLVRPASPAFYAALQRMDYVAFGRDFEEFYGDPQEVTNILFGDIES
jgi:hypothetical protein